MNKIYAGIGSRETPWSVQHKMMTLARQLANDGYTLRSGGAAGADEAFEKGHKMARMDKMEIFLPTNPFNGKYDNGKAYRLLPFNPKAWELVKIVHPKWKKLKGFSQAAHVRNIHQVLGENLDKPVDFVVCYTTTGGFNGGTATAMRLAHRRNVPIFNLYYHEMHDVLLKYLKGDIKHDEILEIIRQTETNL